MATEFKLPEVSEGVESADVGQIAVAVGDAVEQGQVLMDIETDKAVVQLESPYSGTIAALNVSEGDSIPIGTVLLTIEESNGAPAEAPAAEKKPEPDEPKEAEPAEAEPEAVPEPKAETKEETSPTTAPAPSASKAAPAAKDSSNNAPVPAGPATRRLARKLGVDLKLVNGSGPGARVTQEDVENYVKNLITGGSTSGGGGGGITVPPLPDFTQFGEVERQKMKKLARVSANNLSLSWQIIPHVTQHDLADITDLETARKLFISKPNYSGPKVTMTALAMKAVAIVLHEFPAFNSSFDPQTEEIVLKKYINIGVAVDTENGLVVPVVKNVDKKNIIAIAQEMNVLAVKARDRKLEMSDMQGGTFTITNLGGLGGTSFTPIVNYPEVAILGMSRSRNEFQLVNNNPVSRLMLPLSLSYDHRVINGADAARFIVRISSLLSDPFNLLVDC